MSTIQVGQHSSSFKTLHRWFEFILNFRIIILIHPEQPRFVRFTVEPLREISTFFRWDTEPTKNVG